MDQSLVNSGELQCNICNRFFSSTNALLEHRRIHTGERPYTCPVCHKCFTQKGHLNIHKRTHTGEKPYACHICHKRFAQSSHLNTHKRIHTGEKPYYCNICNIGFSRKQRLEVHVLQHMQDGTCPGDFTGLGDITDDATMSFPEILNTGIRNKIANITPGCENEKSNEMAFPQIHAPTLLRRRKPAFVTRVSTEEEDANSFKDDVDLDESSNTVLSNMKCERTETSEQQDSHLLSLFLGNTTETTEFNDGHIGNESDETKKKSESALGKTTTTSTDSQNNVSGDDNDAVSVTSESNHSSSDISIAMPSEKRSMLSYSYIGQRCHRQGAGGSHTSTRHGQMESSVIRANNRICLIDFTTEDLLTHLMSRDDVHRCDFCCIVFQDAAMYHLHKSMHEKMDIRSCNLCGKMSQDKYDFTAHFLSEHK